MPLRLALHGGQVEVARLLVERGADTTGMDEHVATPWQSVLYQGDLELACLFDADATALDNHG